MCVIIYVLRQYYNKQKTQSLYIYNIHIKLDNGIYLYTIIYLYEVNVNFMLIYIELS